MYAAESPGASALFLQDGNVSDELLLRSGLFPTEPWRINTRMIHTGIGAARGTLRGMKAPLSVAAGDAECPATMATTSTRASVQVSARDPAASLSAAMGSPC